MKVEVCWANDRGFNETFTCTHATVYEGALRLEKRPSREANRLGVNTEHVVSIPLIHLRWWKERES